MARKRFPRRYLIDVMMAANEFHIVAGPSGGGKTHGLIQLILDWQAGKPVYGYDSYPEPYLYIARDRGVVDLLDTLEDLGVDPDDESAFDFISLIDSKEYGGFLHDLPGLITKLTQDFPDVKVFFIDGLAMMAPDGFRALDYHSVERYVTMIQRLCHAFDITIVGVMHSPKAKPGERYGSPRQRISGSAAWGAGGHTVILYEEREDKGARPDQRVLTIDVRHGPRKIIPLVFEGTGKLVVDESEDADLKLEVERAEGGKTKLARWYAGLPVGGGFTKQGFIEAAQALSVSLRTAERWLTEEVVACRIDRLKNGTYQKPLVQ